MQIRLFIYMLEPFDQTEVQSETSNKTIHLADSKSKKGPKPSVTSETQGPSAGQAGKDLKESGPQFLAHCALQQIAVDWEQAL